MEINQENKDNGSAVFWFRRDLRLEDNIALHKALEENTSVLPVFIFDDNILDELPREDPRVQFIHEELSGIHARLREYGSGLKVYKGKPETVWKEILEAFEITGVYVNRDYEPYALERDTLVEQLLNDKGIPMITFKDQVVFEPHEILKEDRAPYHVFTPYKNKWLREFRGVRVTFIRSYDSFIKGEFQFPELEELGFAETSVKVLPYDLSVLDRYAEDRDYPWKKASSNLGPHLRFGTISVRQVIDRLEPAHEVFLSELIWREFFKQILFHYPKVIHQNFKTGYDGVQWLNHEPDFEKWCSGMTGYPMVDAGMRQLNATGYMHNRVRMITAGFLCKHLLIDWRWGESYFAKKLLDFELSSNNGNWQWAAGTGCDAAPYFRIFNPIEQQKKFDPQLIYVREWVPEYGTAAYPEPMVDHKMARSRALETYRSGIA